MPHLSVSIVIPTYNRAPLLERALRSALPQCEPGDEILVVDDGSTDGTETVVRGFGVPVRYLRTAHVGAGAARNAGVREARGDLVAFLDSDDEWMPGKLALQRAILQQFPDVLYSFSDFMTVKSSGERVPHAQSSWFRDRRPWDEILAPGISSKDVPGVPGSAPPFRLHIGSLYAHYIRHWSVFTTTVIVRRIAAGDALHFAEDTSTYEDVECYARLAAKGLAGYLDCETAWHHRHVGGQLTDADELTNAEAACTVIGRVWGADAGYLSLHREEFEAVMDGHRDRIVRELLVLGRSAEARTAVARLFHPRFDVRLLSQLPGSLLRSLFAARRRVRTLWKGREA